MEAKKEKLFFVINLILLLSLNLMILFESVKTSFADNSNNFALCVLVTLIAADLLMTCLTEQARYRQYLMMIASCVIYFSILEGTKYIHPIYQLSSGTILTQNTESFFIRLYFSITILRFLKYSNESQATLSRGFRLIVFQYFILYLYFQTNLWFTCMLFESLSFCAFVSLAALILQQLPQIRVEKISIHKLEVE